MLSRLCGDQGPDRFVRKAGYSKMHNDNAVFSLVPEEALIPVNLMIHQNSFCALSDCTNMDNSVSAASQKIPRSRGPFPSSTAHGLSHERLVNLYVIGDCSDKHTSPSHSTTSSMYLRKASTKLRLRRTLRTPTEQTTSTLVGDEKPTR